MISILLVEDHPILSRSIKSILSTADLTVVAVAATGEDALALLPELSVDLALIDVSLPGMNGIDLVARLNETRSDLPCIVLSGHNEPIYIRRALAAGARAYVTKGDVPAIRESIRRVMAGERYLSDNLDQGLLDERPTAGR